MAWTEPKDWTPGEVVTAQDLDTHLKDNMNAVLPLGTYILVVRPYATAETTLEGRWLQCNGVNVSRTTYPELFNLFNTFSPVLPFGTGDGSTTFGIPDARGRSLWAEGENAEVVDVGLSDALAISIRKVSHYHDRNYGSNSVGGSIPNPPSFDTQFVGAFPTTPATSLGDRANHPRDHPAYLVAGSWFIKYRS